MIYEHQCSAVQLSIKLSYILKYWQKCANSVVDMYWIEHNLLIITIDKFAWFYEKAPNFCQFIFKSLQEIWAELKICCSKSAEKKSPDSHEFISNLCLQSLRFRSMGLGDMHLKGVGGLEMFPTNGTVMAET